MTTKTAAPIDLDAAEKAAEQAQEQLSAARQQLAAAEAATKAARADATEQFWDARQRDYIKHYGGRIDAARDAFVDAVRTGGDVHAAWIEYRRTRVVVADEFEAFATWHAKKHDAAVKAKLGQLSKLNTLAGHIDTTPRPGRGQRWQAMIQQWRQDAAAYLGVSDPGDPRALPNDLPELCMARMSGLGGPQADDDNDFARAFAAAVARVEADAVASHQQQRRDELNELIEKATSK